MDVFEIMRARHSVRRYADRPVEDEKRAVLNELCDKINRDNDLHIQIMYDEPRCFDSFMAHYGNFSGVNNYISLVGKKSSNLEETLGYYGEQLVLKAQEIGLNTCWVALTHGKSRAEVNKGEKEVCIISLGYGIDGGVPHRSKSVEELCRGENLPEWFLKGMEGVLLAPTAINQQKFFFELLPDGAVCATAGKGFYTELDLGIGKLHFEYGAGVPVTFVK